MGGGNNGKGVTGNVLLGTVPPIFSMVGTPGNIVDNNAIDGSCERRRLCDDDHTVDEEEDADDGREVYLDAAVHTR